MLGIGCWILAVGYWTLEKAAVMHLEAAAHSGHCKVTKAGGIFQEKPVGGDALLWRDKQTVRRIDPINTGKGFKNTGKGLENKSPGSLFDNYT
jgi:hypothetical protein